MDLEGPRRRQKDPVRQTNQAAFPASSFSSWLDTTQHTSYPNVNIYPLCSVEIYGARSVASRIHSGVARSAGLCLTKYSDG